MLKDTPRVCSKVTLVINYFGEWPFWFEFFLESCKRNKDYRWLIYTDCEIPRSIPDNVKFFSITFKEYCELVSNKIGINFAPERAYKLCDIKPALGLIHEDDIGESPFWGYTDIDVIYGDLNTFFTKDKMERYDVLASGSRRIWGFLCLIRNSHKAKRLFQIVSNWKDIFEDKDHYAFDEKHFSDLFVKHKNFPPCLRNLLNKCYTNTRKVSFEEAWSNPGWKHGWIDGTNDFPDEWYWGSGQLTNSKDDRVFPYLHFIEWKKNEWKNIDGNKIECKNLGERRWIINKKGIFVR